ncbi:hypothetical protein P4233_31780 [Pseudomonas aeruginosa]|nr:hypothetical protein [Pseudomonas aeruginosa]
MSTPQEAASMQQTIDCPIRRRLAHLPWANDGRAGAATGWRCSAIRWPGCRRCTSRSQTSRSPAWARSASGALFHPQAVQELMVDRRDDLQRWQPALCMLKQWNGRSFMMREAPRPGPAQRSTAAPGAAAGQRGSPPGRGAGRAGGGGAQYDLDLEMAAFSVTLSGHALFDVDLQPSAYRIAKAVRLLSRVALLEMSTGLPLGHWFRANCARASWALGQLREAVGEVAEALAAAAGGPAR